MTNRRLSLISLLLAAFAINLDTTIVNVALPSLVRELHASDTQLQWVVDAYSLVFAALVLAAGSLGDRVGRKGLLLAGLAVFGLASIAGGLSTSAGELILARGVMGLGAAMIFPATLSLISNLFTERRERAQAIGLWGASAGVGIAVGPIVGGWLLEHFSWASVFTALVPVAAVAAVLVAVSVPTSRDPTASRLDARGLALSTVAIALLTYTIIEAPNVGWGDPRTLAGLALALALLAAFAVWERRAPAPMLDVALFGNLRFTAASGAVTVSFFALSGFIFLVTQYFQFLKGYGALSTGVRLLPVATTVAISSVLGTKLAVRHGTKLVVAAGLTSLGGAFAWASVSGLDTGYGEIAVQMLFIGAGIGLTSAPATEAIMGVVAPAQAGVGSAVNDATRILGGTLGVAIVGSVYASLFVHALTAALPHGLPAAVGAGASESIGAAQATAAQLARSGHLALASAVHSAATGAFFHGFKAGVLLAAGASLLGAVGALLLLPAQPLAEVSAPSDASPVRGNRFDYRHRSPEHT